MTLRALQRGRLPTRLLTLVIMGALLGLAGHLAADHAVGLEHCAVCAWLQLQAWAVGAVVLLVFFATQYIFSFEGIHHSFSLTHLPRGRSPPHR